MESSTNLSKAAIDALQSNEAVAIYSELSAKGYSLLISKKEYSDIVGCSTSSVDNFIRNGYGCPNYKKLGEAKNSKVLFSLIDVANYLAGSTIQTL